MMELTKERLQEIESVLSAGALGYSVEADEVLAMARQLLAGMEQEPVAWRWRQNESKPWHLTVHSDCAGEVQPLYAAPQLPQPAVVSDEMIDTFEAEFRRAFEVSDGVEQLIEIGYQGEKFSLSIRDAATWWKLGRAAMLQGAESLHDVDNTNRQFESLGCAEDTSRRFKCTGLIVTSDERKMEIPHCSKHPETELQVHPFEQLLSYPPRPVMYCPLCRPSVAEWVEFDKQLRQWKEVK